MAIETPNLIVAALEHMTGPCRGEVSWITRDRTRLALTRSRRLLLLEEDAAADRVIGRITQEQGGLWVEAAPETDIWVNGDKIERRRLKDADVIEFCADGPISRLRIYRQDAHRRHSIAEIFADTVAYLRVSRQPWPVRLWRAVMGCVRGIVLETSVIFRLSILIILAVLSFSSYRQWQESRSLHERFASNAEQMKAFSSALARARDEALTPVDLRTLRAELSERLSAATGRLSALEKQSRASAAVIAAARDSVLFIQGSYGFRNLTSGKMLRHVVDDNGQVQVDFTGNPLLTLNGDGPVAERQYSGTGFLLADAVGIVATNRHVALPWEKDATAEAMRRQGMEPEMIRLAGYFPGQPDAVEFKLDRAADGADLALIRRKGGAPLPGDNGLRLATAAPAPGSEVLVMGYPTGFRALIAQAGKAFIEQIQAEHVTDFWVMGERLAAGHHIIPLASRGIVAQATVNTIVYDAETTHGGSGGPVLNMAGEVVAVNAAILPEYGGSNLGVPVALLQPLIIGGSTQ